MNDRTNNAGLKIFVTVGTQLPFDRLVRIVDDWAGRTPGADVFGQIGPTSYRPRHMRWAQFIDADACRRHVRDATAVVAHAGMGTIITALELGTPVIVVPRLASLGEHRNDHQIATARHLVDRHGVAVAADDGELLGHLARVGELTRDGGASRHARPQLLAVLRDFIQTASGRGRDLHAADERPGGILDATS